MLNVDLTKDGVPLNTILIGSAFLVVNRIEQYGVNEIWVKVQDVAITAAPFKATIPADHTVAVRLQDGFPYPIYSYASVIPLSGKFVLDY